MQGEWLELKEKMWRLDDIYSECGDRPPVRRRSRFPKFRISLGADVLLRVAVGLHSPSCLLICPLREYKHLTYYYDGALRKRSSSTQIRLSHHNAWVMPLTNHTGPASSTSDTEIFRGRDTRQISGLLWISKVLNLDLSPPICPRWYYSSYQVTSNHDVPGF